MTRHITIAALALCVSALATEPVTIKLWPDGAPNPVENYFDADYKAQNNIVDDPVMVVYVPENPNGTVVLGCPGGGYAHLARNHEGEQFAPWLNDQGVTYAMLLYRMPCGRSDVPLSDVRQAMRIIRSGGLGIMPKTVGIMGFSAGGHLASTAATHLANTPERFDFQVLFYPVISLDPTITHRGTREQLIGKKASKALEWEYTNDKQVTPLTPPAIIFHSTDDRSVPVENSLRYYRALLDAGVEAQMHIFPTGMHGWGFNPDFTYHPQWTVALAQFLKQQTPAK